MFDWNDLKFFLELARQGRLMPAARRLKVDHTTVSRRISELERDLAIKIFDRKPDGFVLTEDGHKLYQAAEKIEAAALVVSEDFRSAPTEPTGRVRLTSMEGIAAFYLAEKLVQFNEKHPGVLVELVTERHLINLTKREADVCVSFVPLVGPKLSVKNAGEFKLGLFASSKYIVSRGAPASKEELKRHDFIDYVDDLVAIQPVQWLHDVLVPENVVFRSTSMAAQQNAIGAGRGVGLLPFFSAKKDPRLVRIMKDVVVTRSLFVSVHEDIEYMGRVRTLLRFLHEIFKVDKAFLNEFE
ncbi:DNA-binding transcriptional regulator, LysR family [Bradyrhizobium sp. Rc3b]|uniref:LysR family transcriptional regulator n=1 Tax=Bradyrhizobium sp. Rc3b TaxID=1855322 RepID=UPI0008EB56E5|nr:LysR family transcriptional regulator [Bradyrhizobium sp. Rc3b]SFN78278.1 DNA-binding transcriptional regulator, LysR family [Bradyrhizobium sp. Rc3b]